MSIIQNFIKIQKSGPTNPEWMLQQIKLHTSMIDSYSCVITKLHNDMIINNLINMLTSYIMNLSQEQLEKDKENIEKYIFAIHRAEVKVFNWQGKLTDEHITEMISNYHGYDIEELKKVLIKE